MFGLIIACVLLGVVAAVAGGAAVYFHRELVKKRAGNKLLIARAGELEQQMDICQTREIMAGETLASSCAWYRNLFNHFQEIALVHGLTEDGLPDTFLEVNDGACAVLGYDREELLSRSIMDVLDIEMPYAAVLFSDSGIQDHVRKVAAKVVRSTIEKILERGELVYEDSLKTSANKKIPVTIHAFRCDLMDQPMIMWVARDMTDVRTGQRALQESERRLQDFFSYSPLGIAMYDAEREMVSVNRACLRMFGTPDKREFERFSLFDNPFLPSDAKETLNRGDSVHCEIVVNFDEVRKNAMFVTTRDGKGYYELLISNLGCDQDYKPRGYFAQIQDVSQRRKVEADLRRLQVGGGTSKAEGISGTLADVGFTDLVQILCAGGRSMHIAIKAGDRKADVYIQEGSIIECRVADLNGEEAFYSLMRWQSGTFTAKPCDHFPERTIMVSPMALLMEGARRYDEG